MLVYIFRGNGRVFGFTQNPTGANLPTGYGNWNQFKTLQVSKGVAQPGVNTDECIDDIERYGFHLTDAHVRITDDAL